MVNEEGRQREGPDVGLVGGRLEERVRHTRVPPLTLAHVLAPYRRPGDDAAFEAFVATAPLHVEIGFGRPHFLCELAAQRPDAAVLGFEIKRRWVSVAARRAAREGLANLRVVEGDARPYLERLVPRASVAGFYILFPDPWWKKRHHKRRLFQPSFVELLGDLARDGGELIVRTDVDAYADLIFEEVPDVGGWRLASSDAADPAQLALPRSHREKKCQELGIPAFHFRFVREKRS